MGNERAKDEEVVEKHKVMERENLLLKSVMDPDNPNYRGNVPISTLDINESREALTFIIKNAKERVIIFEKDFGDLAFNSPDDYELRSLLCYRIAHGLNIKIALTHLHNSWAPPNGAFAPWEPLEVPTLVRVIQSPMRSATYQMMHAVMKLFDPGTTTMRGVMNRTTSLREVEVPRFVIADDHMVWREYVPGAFKVNMSDKEEAKKLTALFDKHWPYCPTI